jgi:hypothetical protein
MFTTTIKYERKAWDLSKFKQGMILKITPSQGYGWNDEPYEVELLDFDDKTLYALYTDDNGKHELVCFETPEIDEKVISILR